MEPTSLPYAPTRGIGAPIESRPLDAGEVERCADRLSAVTERMLSFLQSHLSRLHEVARSLDAFARDLAEAEAKAKEIQQRQADWEQQKERDIRRMADDARLLTEAWDRVERERRESLTRGSAVEMAVLDIPVAPAVLPTVTAPPRSSLTDTDLFDLGIPTLTQTPAKEFQQLKREIRQHAQRKR